MDRRKLNLQLEGKANYLYACASGERSRENVIAMTITVFNAALEKKLSKICVDVRELSGYFGFMDIFFLVKEVMTNLRGKGIDQVAVIDVHQTNRKDWFLEPVANSYGLNIRVFTELDTAIKWLEDNRLEPII
jgi:phosphoribosylpyrophosphate synthetase